MIAALMTASPLVRTLALAALPALWLAGPAAAAERRFAATGFDRVTVAGSDSVAVRKGSQFSVIAAGNETALDALLIDVKDGTLRIARKSGYDGMRGWLGGEAVITVTMPVLHGVRIAGSANVSAAMGSGPDFALDVAGSGNARIAGVAADRVAVRISGSGDVMLTGRCTGLSLQLAGSGDADLGGLTCADAQVKVAGSGNAALRATRTADITAAGAGDVLVTGGARCTKTVTGSADVVCR
jgi:hypothetical protein